MTEAPETPIRLDARAFRAWRGPVELQLTPLEFRVLKMLAQHAGCLVTRDQIMREVWGWDQPRVAQSTKTLDMHISWLRRKLGDNARHPRWIITVRGMGFRLERGLVELLNEEPAAAAPTRVVLVQPGDTLIIGGVQVSERAAATARSLRDQLRLKDVALFEGDIELGVRRA